jgi:hypothetical protein
MRFYLELPSDTPSSESTEIWARLLPRDGEKLLAHAGVDLKQPSEFSSGRSEPTGATTLAATSSSNLLPRVESDARENSGQGEWTTARPGQVANLPTESDTGQWRASSQPMPVVQSAFATAVLPQPVQQAAHLDAAPALKSARVFARPTWSPDRVGAIARPSDASTTERGTISRYPVWSAER